MLHGRKKTSARHKKRADELNEVEETPTPLLAAAESQVWPETIPTELPKAKFPALPKPASQAVSAPRIHDEPPPLRLRPSEKRVVLRAANPDDRASSVAAADDFTGRRLASRARKIADERYRERERLRQEEAAPALHQDTGQ
jgi:type IV secretory pathway VirB10-like protein